MSGFGGTSQRPIMRDITHYPSFLKLKLPDFSRTMVSLHERAEGGRRRALRRPRAARARVRRLERIAGSHALRRLVHDLAVARHRRLRDAERATTRAPRVFAAVADALATEYE